LEILREDLKPISKDDITVVIPTLNEEEAIGLVLYEVLGEGYKNVIVVDGYSTDNTVQVAQEHGVSVIVQHGLGKTGAIITVLDYVRTPHMLVMDGDCTYSAKDIEKFLPFARRYDQIFGNRREGRKNISRVHRLGNWIINRVLRLLYGTSISDICTGMYMLKTSGAKNLELTSRGFDVEVEMGIQNINLGRVTEVPISYRKRVGRRKLSTWRQGFQILWTVIKLSLSYNPVFFLTAMGSLFALPGTYFLIDQFYNRLLHGESGWSVGYFSLGLVLFLGGLNCFTIAVNSLLSKRQERRVLREIRDLKK